MPFGLKNAPASFQRLMNTVLDGILNKFVRAYIDDLNVYSKTFEEHIHHLRQVFDRLREAGLKMQRTKCDFIKKELEFLGHIVSTDGLKVDPAKIEKVKEWPRPRNVKEVQQFMGFVGYYRRFIENSAVIAKPLYNLCKKDAEFKWTENCQTAFELMKEVLCSAKVMRYPDFKLPFILTTDASGIGIGAILEQEENGVRKPVAYGSRTLREEETRYTTTELELGAIKWTVKHFKYYLYKPFTVYTDHKALTGILRHQDELSSRINRFTTYLQQCPITILYKEGKANKAADALSRRIQIHEEKQIKAQESSQEQKQ
jgi:hypothetical protein